MAEVTPWEADRNRAGVKLVWGFRVPDAHRKLAHLYPQDPHLSNESYEFALQTHYDFVITDQSHSPLFAVEFDGPGHDDCVQSDRDARKDKLSSQSLPQAIKAAPHAPDIDPATNRQKSFLSLVLDLYFGLRGRRLKHELLGLVTALPPQAARGRLVAALSDPHEHNRQAGVEAIGIMDYPDRRQLLQRLHANPEEHARSSVCIFVPDA